MSRVFCLWHHTLVPILLQEKEKFLGNLTNTVLSEPSEYSRRFRQRCVRPHDLTKHNVTGRQEEVESDHG